MLRRISVIAILLVSCCDLSAATYWVSPKGQTSGTGAETNPFPSVNVALKNTVGGDTLIFKPGVYIGSQITLTARHVGSAQKPTVLKSQHKYQGVLHGSAVRNI